MSTTSLLERIERIDPDCLDADEPMSSYTATMIRNNLAHLIDESCQHRVNMVFNGGLFLLNATETGLDSGIFVVEFVHSWKNKLEPTRLDVYMTGASSDSVESTFEVRIVPAHYAIGDRSAPDALEGAGVGTTSSATDVVLIDELCQMDTGEFASAFMPFIVDEAGEFVSPAVAVMRLELTVSRATSAADPRVNRILVREFC